MLVKMNLPPSLTNNHRWSGLRIGLLGGSFNPPHAGHIHISTVAMRSMKLDAVWWVLSPANPLKDKNTLAPYETRWTWCQDILKDQQKILVSNIEQQKKLTRSYDTITAILSNFPDTQFVWITGMDNAHIFHKWYKWRGILKIIPTAHIARPPATGLIGNCPLKMQSSQAHIYLNKPTCVELNPGHTYWVLQKKMLNLSSTDIRNKIK